MSGNVCDRVNPWTILIGGPATDEEHRNLQLEPANPCGVESDVTGLIVHPMRRLAAWSGCVGHDCPGGRALITGSVQARVADRGAGSLQYVDGDDCESGSVKSEPRLKLRIMACGMRGPVIIDSDSSVVVPAGPATIEVWGPDTWAAYGPIQLAAPASWHDVSLKVMACPLDGFTPQGRLTLWHSTTAVPTVFVTPRRATKLHVAGVTFGGAVSAVDVRFADELTLALPRGLDTFNDAGDTLEPTPGWPFYSAATAAASDCAFTWGIE